MPSHPLNPIEYQDWDDLLLTNPKTTFFHTAAWARVLTESYKYKPLYFAILENKRLSGLLPVMEIRSFLTGKRGVSLPFTDECQPIGEDGAQFRRLLENVITFGKEAGWEHIEFRGGHASFAGAPAHRMYFSHTLSFDNRRSETILATLRDSTRRNIERAAREQVSVVFAHSWKAVETFYRLNCLTRRRHSLPPQPLHFFRALHKHVISPEAGVVALAYRQQRPIAGAVFVHFKGQAIYKYGASDERHWDVRPNNLLLWEAIAYCFRRGFTSFSFGRTEPDNHGLLQFKRGWGTTENGLNYYRYDFTKAGFSTAKKGPEGSHAFFKVMPIPLLRLTGHLFYRHVG